MDANTTHQSSELQAQAAQAGITDEIGIEANTGTTFIYRGFKPGDEIRHCLCGCGLQVVKKAIYRPGHDARHVSQVVNDILEFLEEQSTRPGRKGPVALSAKIREGLGQITRPALVKKAGTRLVKSLSERHAQTAMILIDERLFALEEDEEGEES